MLGVEIRMQAIIKTSCGVALAALLTGCGSSEGGFTGTNPTGPGSNVISAKHFVLSFDNLNPAVYDATENVIFTGIKVQVIVAAGNRYDAAVTAGTVHFRTELGLLSKSSCNLGADGTCFVTWTSLIDGADLTPDRINTITAYTLSGEDGFVDNNANNAFDAGDTLTDDVGDPFLDLSHDGTALTYNLGVDLLILDGIYDAPNGLYDGQECSSLSPPSNCGSASTVIFDTNEMNLLISAAP